MKDVFGNELEISTKVIFMQVGYRFFGVGTIISISPKTCVIEFEGQKVRQFPNQIINVDKIISDKNKVEKISEICESSNSETNKIKLIEKILAL